jgi:probable HAF family extracellular repeat protein
VKPRVAFAVLILACSVSLQIGWATVVSYTYTTIDFPGKTFTTAAGINNSGQIVGSYLGGDGFLDNHGVFTTLPNIPGITNYPPTALGINDLGQIVVSDVGALSFLYSGGVYTPILVPGTRTIANGINNRGQVVGYYLLLNGTPAQGFVDTNGVFTTLDVPGAAATFANSISNSGQVVGSFNDSSGGAHGFLYNNGVFTTIDAPGATFGTTASGINGSSQIIGEFGDSSGHRHGFVDNNGIFTTIEVPGAQVINPFGIGNFGDSIGPGRRVVSWRHRLQPRSPSLAHSCCLLSD